MVNSLPAPVADVAPDGNLTPRQSRHLLIQIARRRVQPGAGSGEAFLRGRTAMISWPDLRPVLRDIDWVLVGGVATRAYMPERMTQELDVLVKSADGEEALARLREAGYILIGQLAIAGYQLRSEQGLKVDLILSNADWLDEALREPEYDPAGYPVLPLPYLVLLKLESSRTQDVADIARM